ncbi:hypothetical protein ANANG_G00167650 [Anguilla anguilla]|uniref:Cadherin domain-containing protein n=1 Tax=Anguilla anguilla TaxID=7936 RepID=A0A9D3RX93_ANGAN|nr:hypothetical protein ANANG_G00167650 [Anguilla anguilla]
MATAKTHPRAELKVQCAIFLLAVLQASAGNIRYSVPEETNSKFVIGSLTKDLSLDLNLLAARNARVDYQGERRYCGVDLGSGEFIVVERIDREKLCGQTSPCLLHFEFILENPLELHNIALEILDINDNAPVFPRDVIKLEITESAPRGSRFQIASARDLDILYPDPTGSSFMTEMVPKAAHARSLVSKVIAVDADSGQNAWLSYQIVKSTDPGLFTIGVHSGEIRVQRDISESDAMKQNLVISVKDNGQPSLSATCAVYLLISDNLAEVPQLKDMSYEENNSKLTSYLIIALVSVSTFFLTFIILMVAVRFCRRRKPRLLFDGAVAIPSAYFPPNYAEVEGAGTLRSSYNYDAYLTTGSRTSDFKFVRSYNDVTMAADQTLKRSPNETSEQEGGNEGESTGSALILYPAPTGNSFMTEMVPKAAHAGSLVSKVIAVDADSGQNAWLSYQIVKSTDPGLFTIGVHSGEIRVQRDISESDAMKQNLVISVKDNGQPSLSATCAVYLLISDNLAEVPQLKDMSYEENNSKLTSYLIIALVSISTFFLTFIILMVAVRFCRRRKPRLLFDGAVAIPSAYFPPNYAEVEGAGTLRSSYNYDAYLTTGSRTSDFKFVRSYNDVTMAADQTLKRSPNEILEGGATESAEVRP